MKAKAANSWESKDAKYWCGNRKANLIKDLAEPISAWHRETGLKCTVQSASFFQLLSKIFISLNSCCRCKVRFLFVWFCSCGFFTSRDPFQNEVSMMLKVFLGLVLHPFQFLYFYLLVFALQASSENLLQFL